MTARTWDAATYERVSGPQLAWAEAVLDRLELGGDETVLDAGCGSGRVTARLAARLPRGRVIAVDASRAMVEHARAALGPNVDVRRADLSELALETPVDAVFSNAVFHWIADHDRLFARLAAALRPGGRLVAQCGGRGNIAAFTARARAAAAEPPFAAHLADWPGNWTFAGPEETAERLERAGFADVACWLEPAPVVPPEPRAFLATVCLGGHLDRLPAALHDAYLDAVLARTGPEPTLDYVRLNLVATKEP